MSEYLGYHDGEYLFLFYPEKGILKWRPEWHVSYSRRKPSATHQRVIIEMFKSYISRGKTMMQYRSAKPRLMMSYNASKEGPSCE